ncbi:uncharacterized protein [Arachis hypogaea]|uniref:uncharacterized protein isoform X5 n=1 Tax=Arachis hypogaea TaxID=3818 RepID=UPI003B212880
MGEGGESSGAKAPCVRKTLDNYRAEKLAQETLEGKWEAVTEMYEKFPGAHTQRISDDDDNTALHVAVDLDNEKVVMELLQAIIKYEKGIKVEKKALEVKNKNGDTALQLQHQGVLQTYADLAFILASKHPFLTRYAHNGITPLHLLAKRPSAFQSTTKLSHCKQLLYHDAKKEKEKCNDEIKWLPLSNSSKKKGRMIGVRFVF